MAKLQDAGNRVLETDYIKIHGNCLEIENTVLQLKNISLFSTVDIDPHPFPMGILLLIIAAIACLWFSQSAHCSSSLCYFSYLDLYLGQKGSGTCRNQAPYYRNKLRAKLCYYIF